MPQVDYFIPLLASLREFQNAPRDDAAALAARIDALLEKARRAALDDGVTPADFDAALFPVVAWADEMLISLDWPGAREWPRRLLQKRLFNLTTAGIEFFARLDRLEREAVELTEVYFTCLCLGFQGRYSYDRHPRELAEIRQQLLSRLVTQPMSSDDRLIPEGYQTHIANRAVASGRRWRFSPAGIALFVAPLVALALLYGIYHVVINRTVSTITQRL